MMTEERKCPKCGARLSADAPEGLCPKCLLNQSKDSTYIVGEGEEGKRPTSEFTPPPPQELAGLFPHLEILELLGQGGMGAVYKARQPGLDRLVALKVLPSEVSKDPTFAERFAREARAMAKLNHPNIVMVHDFGQTGELYYFVMEFVDGVNLRQAMKSGQVAPPQALKIVTQICDALQFAHEEGIVHRDIKPENVLIDKKGRVKIADFGLAKLVGRARGDFTLTSAGQVMGTPHYMAPEQMEKPLEVDQRADIYSLGVVFYEMLTGELPLGRFAPPSQKVQVDVRLDEVVLRSLEREPARRYQKVSEVKTQVESISQSPGQGRAAAPPARPRLCRLPLIGLVTMPLGLLIVATALILVLLAESGTKGYDWGPVVMRLSLFGGAPFLILLVLTTLVGCIGISRIRNSGCGLTGMGLAVADAVFFPLLISDVFLYMFLRPPGSVSVPEKLLVPAMIVLANIAIVRAVWKRAARPAAVPSLPPASATATSSCLLTGAIVLAVGMALVMFLAFGSAVFLGVVGREHRAVYLRGDSFASDPFAFGPDGPIVSKGLAQTLDLRPLEEQEINKAVQKAYREYTTLESKHTKVEKVDNGRVRVTISPFGGEFEALQKRLWSDLDKVLSERQQAVARKHLPLRQIFPYGDNTATIDLWQDGMKYYWKEQTKGGFLSSGSKSGSGLAFLDENYKRYWDQSHAAVPTPTAPMPEITQEEEALRRALNEKRVDLRFEETPVRDVVNFLRTLTQINLALVGEGCAKATVSLEVKDAKLSEALKIICTLAGPDVKWDVLDNCVCIGHAADLAATIGKKPLMADKPSESELGLLRMLREKRAKLSLEEVPFTDAVSFLKTLAECNIVVAEKEVATGRTVSLEVENASLDTMLRLLCGPELNYAIRDNVVLISRDDPK